VQPIQIGSRVWRRFARIEYGFGALQKIGLPLRDLGGVDVVLVANSASGCSPRMASSATFALKAAEWLRRGLLTVCSPRTGEIFAQLSKAVTFYPGVRIRGATSIAQTTPKGLTFFASASFCVLAPAMSP